MFSREQCRGQLLDDVLPWGPHYIILKFYPYMNQKNGVYRVKLNDFDDINVGTYYFCRIDSVIAHVRRITQHIDFLINRANKLASSMHETYTRCIFIDRSHSQKPDVFSAYREVKMGSSYMSRYNHEICHVRLTVSRDANPIEIVSALPVIDPNVQILANRLQGLHFRVYGYATYLNRVKLLIEQLIQLRVDASNVLRGVIGKPHAVVCKIGGEYISFGHLPQGIQFNLVAVVDMDAGDPLFDTRLDEIMWGGF